MKCLETRLHTLPTIAVRWRRYRNDAGEVTTTCEVPTELWNRLAIISGETGLVVTRLVVTRANTADATAKRDKAFELIDEGWKPAAIAHELGLHENTVTKYKRKRKQNAQ